MNMALENNIPEKILPTYSCSWPDFRQSSMFRASSCESIFQPVQINDIEMSKINTIKDNNTGTKCKQNFELTEKYIFNSYATDKTSIAMYNASKKYNNDSNCNTYSDDKYVNMNQVVPDLKNKEEQLAEKHTSLVMESELNPNSINNSEENKHYINEFTEVPITSVSTSNKYSLEADMIKILQDIITNFPHEDNNTAVSSKTQLNILQDIITNFPHEDNTAVSSKTKLNNNKYVSSQLMFTEEIFELDENDCTSIYPNVHNNKTNKLQEKLPITHTKQTIIKDTGEDQAKFNYLEIISNILTDVCKYDNTSSTELLTSKQKNVTNTMTNTNKDTIVTPQNNKTESNEFLIDIHSKIMDSITNASTTDIELMDIHHPTFNSNDLSNIFKLTQTSNSVDNLNLEIDNAICRYEKEMFADEQNSQVKEIKLRKDAITQTSNFVDNLNLEIDNAICRYEKEMFDDEQNSQVKEIKLRKDAITQTSNSVDNLNLEMDNAICIYEKEMFTDEQNSHVKEIKLRKDAITQTSNSVDNLNLEMDNAICRYEKEMFTDEQNSQVKEIKLRKDAITQTSNSVDNLNLEIDNAICRYEKEMFTDEQNSQMKEIKLRKDAITQTSNSVDNLNLEIDNAICRYEKEMFTDEQNSQVKEIKLRKDAITQTDICNILHNINVCNCIEYYSLYKESSSLGVEVMSLSEIEAKVARKRSIQALYLELPTTNKRVKTAPLSIISSQVKVTGNEGELFKHPNNGCEMEEKTIQINDKVEDTNISCNDSQIEQHLTITNITTNTHVNKFTNDQEVPEVIYEEVKSSEILFTGNKGCRNFHWEVQHATTDQDCIDEDIESQPNLNQLPKRSLRVGLSRHAKPKKLHISYQ